MWNCVSFMFLSACQNSTFQNLLYTISYNVSSWCSLHFGIFSYGMKENFPNPFTFSKTVTKSRGDKTQYTKILLDHYKHLACSYSS
jgi:hypothetical protein